jgi:hypothetical protein
LVIPSLRDRACLRFEFSKLGGNSATINFVPDEIPQATVNLLAAQLAAHVQAHAEEAALLQRIAGEVERLGKLADRAAVFLDHPVQAYTRARKLGRLPVLPGGTDGTG